ncbi:MAG: hypothetical protein K0Q93_736 [Nocardioidaceae bacterium]|jgi:hypothetical protein|nr:hypothetical protein [Nocardioidaceae bacterium]
MNADEPTVRLLDGVVGFWLVLWLAVGVASGYTFWDASSLGDTVTRSGEALGSAGSALETLGEVPVVGEGPAELGSEVSSTAADIVASGGEIKTDLRRLALLLGLSIALMPTTPVLGLYLPLRLTRRRDSRDLQRAIGQHGRDPALDRYLAERATHMLPYSVVRSLSDDPFKDIAQGRTRHLADAELRRLGLRSPATQA